MTNPADHDRPVSRMIQEKTEKLSDLTEREFGIVVSFASNLLEGQSADSGDDGDDPLPPGLPDR
jgi:hypothetical protein